MFDLQDICFTFYFQGVIGLTDSSYTVYDYTSNGYMDL